MQWGILWGKGFPGWHIECTAMSTKYLGEQFDIHTGGKEHVPVHHTNEIAQAYGAFGHQTANYWLHNEWLVVKGAKASKSLGNVYLVSDILDKGINPLALRYLIMTSHYRAGLEFSWESLGAAQTALSRLYENVAMLRDKTGSVPVRAGGVKLSDPKGVKAKCWQEKFIEAISDDLNMPQALALVWEMLKSDLEDDQKYGLLLDWDRVLGLNLKQFKVKSEKFKVDEEIQKLVDEREKLRREEKWQDADEVREKIEKEGWTVEDTESGPKLKKKLPNE